MSAEYNAKFANTDIATRAIHAGQEPDPTTGAVVTPIFATSTFKQDGVLGLRGGHDYSRSINPTRTSFDEQLAAVEGGKYALSFSSGLAAIDVLLRSTIKPGDNILLGNDVYGGTYRLLSKVFVPWGVGLDVVNITDLKAVETALASKHYQYVWVETPSNPLLNITDIAATTEVAQQVRHQGRCRQHLRLARPSAPAGRWRRCGGLLHHQVHRRPLRRGRRCRGGQR